MLAQLGRRPRNRTGGLAELRGRARLPHLTKAVVESPFDRLTRDNLLVLKEFRAPQERRVRHVIFIQPSKNLLRGPFSDFRQRKRLTSLSILTSGPGRGEAFIIDQILSVESTAHTYPFLIGNHSRGNEAIERGID